MFEMHDLNIVCPKCGNPNYMRLMSGENVGKLNVKCTNCNSYFAFNDLEKGGKMVDSEPKETWYLECSSALLKMWLENIVTDGEYRRISEKLEKYRRERRQDG